MHDKRKCKKCVYHNTLLSGKYVICNYGLITGTTCLTANGRKTTDKRGNDYDRCKLFEEGAMIKDRVDIDYGERVRI